MSALRYAAIALLDRLAPAGRNRFGGCYASWAEASRACGKGYASQTILDKVRLATQEVVEGQAAFERDSVTFQQAEFNWPLVAVLLRLALRRRAPFSVLDFGGALGSVFHQHRALLEEVPGLRWCVVEQEHYVACGRARFETDRLRFYESVGDCLAQEPVALALFSSVLAYVPEPWQVLDEVVRAGIDIVFIDQTLVLEAAQRDRIVVQRAPASICRACYPMRLFAERGLARPFAQGYECKAVLKGFDAPAVLVNPWQVAVYKGYLWSKKA